MKVILLTCALALIVIFSTVLLPLLGVLKYSTCCCPGGSAFEILPWNVELEVNQSNLWPIRLLNSDCYYKKALPTNINHQIAGKLKSCIGHITLSKKAQFCLKGPRLKAVLGMQLKLTKCQTKGDVTSWASKASFASALPAAQSNQENLHNCSLTTAKSC